MVITMISVIAIIIIIVSISFSLSSISSSLLSSAFPHARAPLYQLYDTCINITLYYTCIILVLYYTCIILVLIVLILPSHTLGRPQTPPSS